MFDALNRKRPDIDTSDEEIEEQFQIQLYKKEDRTYADTGYPYLGEFLGEAYWGIGLRDYKTVEMWEEDKSLQLFVFTVGEKHFQVIVKPLFLEEHNLVFGVMKVLCEKIEYSVTCEFQKELNKKLIESLFTLYQKENVLILYDKDEIQKYLSKETELDTTSHISENIVSLECLNPQNTLYVVNQGYVSSLKYPWKGWYGNREQSVFGRWFGQPYWHGPLTPDNYNGDNEINEYLVILRGTDYRVQYRLKNREILMRGIYTDDGMLGENKSNLALEYAKEMIRKSEIEDFQDVITEDIFEFEMEDQTRDFHEDCFVTDVIPNDYWCFQKSNYRAMADKKKRIISNCENESLHMKSGKNGSFRLFYINIGTIAIRVVIQPLHIYKDKRELSIIEMNRDGTKIHPMSFQYVLAQELLRQYLEIGDHMYAKVGLGEESIPIKVTVGESAKQYVDEKCLNDDYQSRDSFPPINEFRKELVFENNRILSLEETMRKVQLEGWGVSGRPWIRLGFSNVKGTISFRFERYSFQDGYWTFDGGPFIFKITAYGHSAEIWSFRRNKGEPFLHNLAGLGEDGTYHGEGFPFQASKLVEFREHQNEYKKFYGPIHDYYIIYIKNNTGIPIDYIYEIFQEGPVNNETIGMWKN